MARMSREDFIQNVTKGTQVQFIPDLKTYTINGEVGYNNEVLIKDNENNHSRWVNIADIQKIEERKPFPSIEEFDKVKKPAWLRSALAFVNDEIAKYSIAKEAYDNGLNLQWELK